MREDSIKIREVWKYNLELEMLLIRRAVDKFPYVAFDTEYPGVVCKPVGTFFNSKEYIYETLKMNVNLLNVIQLGLTLSDVNGNLPTDPTENRYCVWQFNFREFNLNSDFFALDSIELLQGSGINFTINNKDGIDSKDFVQLFMTSGLLFKENIHWLTFHGIYDFGYFLKLLSREKLPETQTEFFDIMKVFFPKVYDIKYLLFCDNRHGGLNSLAESLGVERVGISHQAGSDSLLTSCTFHRMMKEQILPIESMERFIGVFCMDLIMISDRFFADI